MGTVALSGCSDDARPNEDAGDSDAGADTASYPDPFTELAMDAVRISSTGSDGDFQTTSTELDLGDGPFASVTMTMTLGTTCYPFQQWADDPPPEGHNWPPKCDAFDRNFDIWLAPPEGSEEPRLVLMRAITPFGGPMEHQFDVTDIFNARPGSHELFAHISTWPDGSGRVSGSDGGWFVTVRFDVEPGPAPRNVLAVMPLENRYLGPGTFPETRNFSLPEGTTSGRVEYYVSGHGGGNDRSSACIGPAEEFCRRRHIVYVDDEEYPLEAWREDCGDWCTLVTDPTFGIEHCLENPTGDVRSVNAPRANWCPGTLTEAYVFEPESLGAPGEHLFAYEIADIEEGGGWSVDAIVYAYGD